MEQGQEQQISTGIPVEELTCEALRGRVFMNTTVILHEPEDLKKQNESKIEVSDKVKKEIAEALAKKTDTRFEVAAVSADAWSLGLRAGQMIQLKNAGIIRVKIGDTTYLQTDMYDFMYYELTPNK